MSFVDRDWREADHYKYLDDFDSKEQWAWEFLRRNPEYQRDYDIAKDKNILYGKNKKKNAIFSPRRHEDESPKMWRKKVIYAGNIPMEYSPMRYYGKKWGINGNIQNPEHDDTPKFYSEAYPKIINRYSEVERYLEPDSLDPDFGQPQNGVVLIAFDVNGNRDSQIQSVRELLSNSEAALIAEGESKSPKTNFSRKSLAKEIRHLDAKSKNAEAKDIYEFLYRKSKYIEKEPQDISSDMSRRLKEAKNKSTLGGVWRILQSRGAL